MAEQKDKKSKKPEGLESEVCRDLICAEEWKDPANRKVLTEYHKEGLPKELVGVDADLETFEKYWKKKGGSVKVKGEYHKNGAPFLDKSQGLDAVKMPEESVDGIDEAGPSEQEKVVQLPENAAPKTNMTSETPRSPGPSGTAPPSNIQRPIDFGLIEMASYALFRVAFSNGVNIPIKREGMIDMNVTVKGKEITINTNQLFFSVPELNVWHIVYEHKGKPILELGRGVKNGMKVHRLQAIRLGFEMWNGSRKINKEKLKQMKEADAKAHEV